MRAELVITAASAVTPYGLGTEAYTQGIAIGPMESSPIEGCYAPNVRCSQVPHYDAREVLSVRSISALDRLTLHVCVAVDQLHKRLGLSDMHKRRVHLADERISLVLGSSGPLQSILDFDLQTIQEPRYVQPSMVPNVVFNVPASYAAIRHGIRGSCITLTDGDTSSLKALGIAAAQLESGRIDLALVGGAEEATPAYGLYCAALSAANGHDCPELTEGAAMFTLERADHARAAGRSYIAGLYGCAQVFSPGAAEGGLTACLAKLRRRFASVLAEVTVVYGNAQMDLKSLGLDHCRSVAANARLGHAGAMSASMAMLDALANQTIAAGELILVLQTDREGVCAAALLQKHAALQ